MKEVLNIISIIASFVVVFTTLFAVQEYTIGLLPIFKRKLIFKKLYLKELIFSFSSLLLILLFVEFIKPYN